MNTTRGEKMYENMNKNNGTQEWTKCTEKSNNFMDGNWLKEWFIL